MPPPQHGNFRVGMGRGQEGQGEQGDAEELARGEQDGEALLDDEAELRDLRRGRRAAPQYGDAPEAQAEGDTCGLESVRVSSWGGNPRWRQSTGGRRT